MWKRIFLLLGVLSTCLPAAAKPATFPRTVRDARGVTVLLSHAPHRIVSLAPGITEMLFSLGLGPRVVGVTTFCNYPPAARRKAKIGDVNTNYEAVLNLHPDLIVGSDANGSAVTRLTQMHQPVLDLHAVSFSDVEQSLGLLGHATGNEMQAKAVISGMETRRHAAATLAARDPRPRPRVLIVVGVSPMWTAGADTFMNDVVSLAGGINIAVGVHQYAPFSKEALLVHPPDFILAGPGEIAAMKTDPVLRSLPAVRSGRFISVPNQDTLTRPGPRLADALLLVAQALHAGRR